MREYLLVVPDLVMTADAADMDGAGEAARLRFAAARPLRGGWRACVAEACERPGLESVAPATLVAASLPPAGEWRPDAPPPWLATPLHLVAGLETVHLPRDGILQLRADERDELAASFDAVLGGARLRLRVAGGEAFVLEGLELASASAVEPLDCLGGELARAQPSGPGAAVLRRLMAEIEMWLHDHPVNRRRESRGERAVRSLWLWGAQEADRPAPGRPATGSEPVTPRTGEPRSSAIRVHADDAWVRALAQLAGVALAPEGEWPAAIASDDAADRLVVVTRLHAGGADLASFERRHLAAAFAALQSGRLERLTLAAADRAVSLHAADRWRVWRPRRPWTGALGA